MEALRAAESDGQKLCIYIVCQVTNGSHNSRRSKPAVISEIFGKLKIRSEMVIGPEIVRAGWRHPAWHEGYQIVVRPRFSLQPCQLHEQKSKATLQKAACILGEGELSRSRTVA